MDLKISVKKSELKILYHQVYFVAADIETAGLTTAGSNCLPAQ
ncbi:hypothetical protein [Pseudobacteriovorax antillogorgiicola]|nr:hypothetical protein [Pseudobacteriovorax antillogorgiicola]